VLRPVVALLTDFGARDHYVGTMKGVVLGICRDATLVDISHDVPPQDILAGALELAAAYRYFPPRTVFLVVIDPGVGSARRAIAASVAEHFFVAPDNGVLSAVFATTPPDRVVALEAAQYARPGLSRTFEGRDRFAPAAAHLANGVALTAFGRPVHDYHSLSLPTARVGHREIHGEVTRIDRFGNLITNIDRATFERVAAMYQFVITVGPREIAQVVGTYADAAPADLIALFGSTDHLEVSVSGGSAAEVLAVGRGAAVTVKVVGFRT
jgi:S-adenosylmethionine hydrolase